MSFEQADFKLYTFWRSTGTARVRIAAKLKSIPLKHTYVNAREDQQFAEAFSQLNPNRTVPVLTVTSRNSQSIYVHQSVAIQEFFQEAFPDRVPLLPPVTDLAGRAHVRDLVNLITADMQPPTNWRIPQAVEGLGGDVSAWAGKIMGEGLNAFDEVARNKAGKYSYGDAITLADVVLAPALENAVQYGVDSKPVPTVQRVFQAICSLPDFEQADWRHQGDTVASEVTPLLGPNGE